LILEKHTVGRFFTNNYILGDDDTRNVVIIDAGDGISEVLAIVKERFLNVKYILITHGHYDHTLGATQLREETGAKIAMSELDLPLTGSILKPDILLNHDDNISFDGFNIRVISTPGHTPGGLCFKYSNLLFSGDTLFFKDVGRCDLEGGNFEILKDSISTKLFTLNDNVKVHPGHGENTTIGFEKHHNPHVKGV